MSSSSSSSHGLISYASRGVSQAPGRARDSDFKLQVEVQVVVYYCRTYVKGRVKRGETCAMGSCYDPPRPVWRASDESDQWQPGPPRTGTNVWRLARAWANRVTLSRPPASERLGLGGPSLSVARVSTPGPPALRTYSKKKGNLNGCRVLQIHTWFNSVEFLARS